MTRRINEQVKTLGSIIVDFKEKDTLQKTQSAHMQESIRQQGVMMEEILERLRSMEPPTQPLPEQTSQPYQLYFPARGSDPTVSDTDTEDASNTVSSSYTTAPTRPTITFKLPTIQPDSPAGPSFIPRGYKVELDTCASPSSSSSMQTPTSDVDWRVDPPGESSSSYQSTPTHRPLRQAGPFKVDYSRSDPALCDDFEEPRSSDSREILSLPGRNRLNSSPCTSPRLSLRRKSAVTRNNSLPPQTQSMNRRVSRHRRL